MVSPLEVIELRTMIKTEVRTDPETDEQYEEEIIIAKDKKTKSLIDIADIVAIEEHVNDDGIIYAKRVLITVAGMQKIVAMGYNEMKELFLEETKAVGFGRKIQDKKKSS